MKKYANKTNAVFHIVNDYYGLSEELSELAATMSPMSSQITHGIYFAVFDGPYSGCYYSYSDACEAAWYSTEVVETYKKLTAAKHALFVYKKKNGVG
jgi:hypothetical protein